MRCRSPRSATIASRRADRCPTPTRWPPCHRSDGGCPRRARWRGSPGPPAALHVDDDAGLRRQHEGFPPIAVGPGGDPRQATHGIACLGRHRETIGGDRRVHRTRPAPAAPRTARCPAPASGADSAAGHSRYNRSHSARIAWLRASPPARRHPGGRGAVRRPPRRRATPAAARLAWRPAAAGPSHRQRSRRTGPRSPPGDAD